MFSFRKKHKYTAYHDKNKHHTYTFDSDDDDHESESFLNDDFEDVPSDEDNDDFPQQSGSGRDRADKHYNNSTSKSSTATSTVSVSVISDDNKNTRKSTFSAPDPEIDDQIDAKKKKLGEYKSKDNKKSKNNAKTKTKSKGKFMSRMMGAIKSKTSKFGKNKKCKYDKQSSGERSITPLTTSEDDASDYDE